MKIFFNLPLLILLNGTVFSQSFPVLIPELYPYHIDPTTVFWREDQHCIPNQISRYAIQPNGDSTLHYYQRSFSVYFTASSQTKTITVNYKDYILPDFTYSHTYDTLGRKVYFEERRPNPNPPNNMVLYQSKKYYYHSNTPWLDSIYTISPNISEKRDIFHYDQNDRLANTDHYYRNLPNGLWIKSGFETRIYDANGQLAQIEINTSQPSEILTYIQVLTYDNANRISTIISTNVVTNTLYEKYAYTYNEADSISTQIRYQWTNGDWKWDSQKSIDLGIMNRVDERRSNSISSVDSKLTLKYTPGETCPYMCFDDWLNLNQRYRLYFSYPTTAAEEPAKEDIPLSVYPNPADGIFWVESPAKSKLVLQDILGRIVWQGTSTGKDQVVLPSGTNGYLLLHANLNNQKTFRMVLIQ